MKKILIINGPNLNFLGKREPEIYGSTTLEEIQSENNLSFKSMASIEWYQSNIEGDIVTRIQNASLEDWEALIINPGGYAHTSVAIHDAMKILKIPVIEVHLSQIYKREDFRHTLLTAKAASAIMSGFGKQTYYMAIHSLFH